MKIAIISGSHRINSQSEKVSRFIEKTLADKALVNFEAKVPNAMGRGDLGQGSSLGRTPQPNPRRTPVL